jgi:hypothetical protein
VRTLVGTRAGDAGPSWGTRDPQSIRQSFETAAELAVDHHLSAVATLTCNWTINSARDLAWNNARLLWAVRDDPLARGLFLDSLAASTALASRMLLVAV